MLPSLVKTLPYLAYDFCLIRQRSQLIGQVSVLACKILALTVNILP